MNKKKVIVVGGGFAGLSASIKLLKEGYEVELYEKRDLLGGKWSAWQDKSGDWIETGLHVFFGAYEEIFTLMKELKIYDRIDWKEHVLTYTLNEGERFEFKTVNLPSPFHLLPAVFKNHYFNWLEKLSLWKALFPMLFGSKEYIASQDAFSYRDWHRSFGIADKMLKKMFVPMTLALKFLTPEHISAKIVLDVTGTFLRENTASKIGFLKGSPETHLTDPMRQEVLRLGGKIHLGKRLAQIETTANQEIEALHFGQADGSNPEQVKADFYVLALPIHNLKKVLPDSWDHMEYFSGLKKIGSVPVITMQLWLSEAACQIDNILFCPDGDLPVYADMGQTTAEYRFDGKSRFQFVVAPAFGLMELTDEQLVDRIWTSLKSLFPEGTAKAVIVKHAIVRVPQSVYWPAPNTDKYRVPQKSPIKNLALAGGYTLQKFYDSMEGAVRSGNRAAEAIVAQDRNLAWAVRD